MSQIFFWIGRFDESRKLEPYFLLFSYYPRGPSNFLSGQSGKSCWKIDRCLEELPLGKGSLPFQLFPAFSSSFQKNPFISRWYQKAIIYLVLSLFPSHHLASLLL